MEKNWQKKGGINMATKEQRLSELESRLRKEEYSDRNPRVVILVGIEPGTLKEVSHTVILDRSQSRSN